MVPYLREALSSQAPASSSHSIRDAEFDGGGAPPPLSAGLPSALSRAARLASPAEARSNLRDSLVGTEP
jgi:hypothetical protein